MESLFGMLEATCLCEVCGCAVSPSEGGDSDVQLLFGLESVYSYNDVSRQLVYCLFNVCDTPITSDF